MTLSISHSQTWARTKASSNQQQEYLKKHDTLVYFHDQGSAAVAMPEKTHVAFDISPRPKKRSLRAACFVSRDTFFSTRHNQAIIPGTTEVIFCHCQSLAARVQIHAIGVAPVVRQLFSVLESSDRCLGLFENFIPECRNVNNAHRVASIRLLPRHSTCLSQGKGGGSCRGRRSAIQPARQRRRNAP